MSMTMFRALFSKDLGCSSNYSMSKALRIDVDNVFCVNSKYTGSESVLIRLGEQGDDSILVMWLIFHNHPLVRVISRVVK